MFADKFLVAVNRQDNFGIQQFVHCLQIFFAGMAGGVHQIIFFGYKVDALGENFFLQALNFILIAGDNLG